jgi:hypothetical protein
MAGDHHPDLWQKKGILSLFWVHKNTNDNNKIESKQQQQPKDWWDGLKLVMYDATRNVTRLRDEKCTSCGEMAISRFVLRAQLIKNIKLLLYVSTRVDNKFF